MSEHDLPSRPEAQGDPPGGLAGLTEEILPALIARLRASGLGELEVRHGGWRVRLRRDPAVRVGGGGSSLGAAEGMAGPAPGTVVRSPAVGYFSPVPELVVGASVGLGDVLGTIDVLGIAQEVTSPADGLVAVVLAEEGQAVEYGQALAEIDPLEVDGDPPGDRA